MYHHTQSCRADAISSGFVLTSFELRRDKSAFGYRKLEVRWGALRDPWNVASPSARLDSSPEQIEDRLQRRRLQLRLTNVWSAARCLSAMLRIGVAGGALRCRRLLSWSGNLRVARNRCGREIGQDPPEAGGHRLPLQGLEGEYGDGVRVRIRGRVRVRAGGSCRRVICFIIPPTEWRDYSVVCNTAGEERVSAPGEPALFLVVHIVCWHLYC